MLCMKSCFMGGHDFRLKYLTGGSVSLESMSNNGTDLTGGYVL